MAPVDLLGVDRRRPGRAGRLADRVAIVTVRARLLRASFWTVCAGLGVAIGRGATAQALIWLTLPLVIVAAYGVCRWLDRRSLIDLDARRPDRGWWGWF